MCESESGFHHLDEYIKDIQEINSRSRFDWTEDSIRVYSQGEGRERLEYRRLAKKLIEKSKEEEFVADRISFAIFKNWELDIWEFREVDMFANIDEVKDKQELWHCHFLVFNGEIIKDRYGIMGDSK